MPATPASAVNTGAEFQDEGVARAYAHRTDYPPALYARLLALAPGRGRLLDLGCGPGKLGRALAARFDQVLAVDPSAAMLRLGRALDAGAHPNIVWIEATAEAAPLEAPVDLIVAGASVHWMDPARVFPRLASVLSPSGVMALIDGDGPAQAPWIEAWRGVVKDWVGRLGGVWDGPAHRALVSAHEPWFEAFGAETFTALAEQAVEDLIEAEHSRATWARSKMGERAGAFDADLRRVLEPYAQGGMVSFEVSTRLTWGRPLAQPRISTAGQDR